MKMLYIKHRSVKIMNNFAMSAILAAKELGIDFTIGQYEQRLIDEWEHAFAAMEETLSETNNATEGEKAKEGRQLFSDIEKRDIRIRPKCQEAFIMRGSYHILANQLKIGWHVDFFDRLKQLLNT